MTFNLWDVFITPHIIVIFIYMLSERSLRSLKFKMLILPNILSVSKETEAETATGHALIKPEFKFQS